MADLDTNLEIIEEFTQRLQVAVLGAEETTANHEYWVTGPEDGTIPTSQGPLKTLRGQIADWFEVANQTVADAIVGFDNEFTQQLITYDEEFSQYLLNIGFEPPILYAAGLTVERISQTYVYNGVTYYWTGVLPYVTTGSFGTETGWLIAPITGGIEIPAFTFATGGQLIRRTQTVLGVDGEWYYWTGNLPKTIPAASTVVTAGGVGEGLFKLAAGVFPVRPMLTILATATGNVLNSGSFEYGATVPTNNNLLAQLGTGRMYRWAGSLPKVVNINSTPENSGGIGPSAWVLVDSAQGVDGSTIIQETPPTSPTRGMRWSRCSDMKSFVWYVDVDGGQWVEDNPSMGGIPSKHNDLLERNTAGAHDAIYRRAATVAQVENGDFEIDAQLSLTDRADAPFDIVAIGANVVNGFDILDAGVGKVAVYKAIDGIVNVKHLGGKSGINSSGAALAAFSLSNQVHFPDDDIYEIEFDNTIANNAFFTYENERFVYITGSAATIKDINAYSGSLLTDIIKFKNCGVVSVTVNFDANEIADIGAPSPLGLGYVGSSALYFEQGCSNIFVKNKMGNVRYGVRSGDYLNTALTKCSNFNVDIDCNRVGYPIALYNAENIHINITSNIQHRAVYLSGCKNVRGNVNYKGFTYATVAVLLTSQLTVAAALDADRRANGCSDVKLNVTDAGSSTTTTSFRAMCGIAYQWKAPDTEYKDIHIHINGKSSNSDNGLAAFRLENTIGWMPTNHHENITISGLFDRSEQTAWTGIWSTISIDGIATGDTSPYLNSPTFSQIKLFDLAIPSQGPTNHANKLNIPRLQDKLILDNVQAPLEDFLITSVVSGATVYLNGSSIADVTTDSFIVDMAGIESTVGTIATGITYRNQSSVRAPSGRDTNIDGMTYKWFQFNYTNAPNPQTATYPTPFKIAAYNAQLTPTFVAGVTFNTGTTTTTGVSVSASANCTFNVLVIGAD